VTAAGIGLAATLLIHTVFYKLLLVPLPWGILQPLEW
jgi:putative tricarboxylic transport membrane protein